MLDLRLRKTVLIVDDEPSNIDVLRQALNDEYAVRIATNGDKALRIIYSDDPPDIILLDVIMPGLSGHEICRRLKANPDRRKIPVIFVTALDSHEDEQLGLEIGAVDYITKPIRPAIVRARVKTHLALYDQACELECMVRQRTRELEISRGQIIRRLGRAAEFKDNETGNHVIRMSHYARLLGERIGLGPASLDILFSTAPMHDIGKLGIPDAILRKPGKLTPDEFELMKRHVEIGAEIIGHHDNELLATARTIVLTHHEKWDGSGYPYGLSGSQIPLFGRVVAVADVLDALLSKRPYKTAFDLDQTMEIMNQSAGSHFDPELIEALNTLVPAIAQIRGTYVDEHGPLTDLEYA